MKKIFFVLLCICSIQSFSQNNKTEKKQEQVYEYTEQMPEFPGGEDALMQFLSSQLKYPQKALEKNKEGKVVCSFIIRKDGSVSKVKVKKGIGFGCDEEAVRVLKLMPKWKPGYQNNKPVNVHFTLPISFQLED